MRFLHKIKVSAVLGLLLTRPLYCSSAFDEEFKNDVCLENVTHPDMDLLALANGGQQFAQDKIIGKSNLGGMPDISFDNIKIERWSMLLESAEYEDFYASFALRLNSEVIYKYFPKLLRNIIHRAQLGVPAALTNLGYMYSKGLGVQKDNIRAVHCYKRAAKYGDVAAYYNLAKAYQLGRGISLNNYDAHSYYVKAAENGYLSAQNELGMQYSKGAGVPMDCATAAEWLAKAARQDFSAAQNNLGLIYIKGFGIEQNIDEAISWMEKAANHGHAEAFLNLGMIFEKHQNNPAVQSRTRHLNADSIAAQLYLRAAEKNLAEAQYRFALCCSKGLGVALNSSLAFEWFERAAHQNHLGAIYEFGAMVEAGNVRGKDLSQAAKWYANAAEKGCEKSRNALARIFHEGFIPEDPLEQLRFKILINSGGFDAEIHKSVFYRGKKDPFRFHVGYAKYYNFVPVEVTIFTTYLVHIDELANNRFDNLFLAEHTSLIHWQGNALRVFLMKVQKVSKLLMDSPVMCTNFSLAPELIHAEQTPENQFFHIYRRKGQIYFTMGSEQVKTVSSLDTLLDNQEAMVGVHEYCSQGYLTKRAIWSAACKLKKQSVFEDDFEQAIINIQTQTWPTFNTLGQALSHITYLLNSYVSALKDIDVLKKSSMDTGKNDMFAVLKKAERRLQKEYQWTKDGTFRIEVHNLL
jgi:TPR repeat protein